ncbi:hypothetical protein GP475_04685 [Corynebacterium poyangense]|uniref:Uncharacterized protein n=1 Tax=Corynebacterium poyangense TaxID=2684405 RepID=A0A7H0SN92_9CORY|nr:hypothetical protein [Corynebacterium poyangense]QNQ90017.1 hypothetical protein GP475_04685 [Corynebacterium poyangense]
MYSQNISENIEVGRDVSPDEIMAGRFKSTKVCLFFQSRFNRVLLLGLVLVICLFAWSTRGYLWDKVGEVSVSSPAYRSFLGRWTDVVGDDSPSGINLGDHKLKNPHFDSVQNFIVDGNRVFSVKDYHVIFKGFILPPVSASDNLVNVFDGVAMYSSGNNGYFVDLSTRKVFALPEGFKAIRPLGIFSNNLVVGTGLDTESGLTKTIGFDSNGNMKWSHDSTCKGGIQNESQLVLVENCASYDGEHDSRLLRRTLDVKSGVVAEFQLSANEYLDVIGDDRYVIDAVSGGIRRFDEHMALIPEKTVSTKALGGAKISYNGYHVIFRTYDLFERTRGLERVDEMISNDPYSTNTFMVLNGGMAVSIDSDFQCSDPVFIENNQRYICGFGERNGLPFSAGAYSVYDTESRQLINSGVAEGLLIRFNGGLASFLFRENGIGSQLFLVS